MKTKLHIGVSDCGDKHPNYANWITGGDENIEVIQLGYRFNNLNEINKCDALLLTGGHDVLPALYGKPELIEDCNPNYMDPERDKFELLLLDKAFIAKMPVLGICRGLQITNTYLKGTLVADIPKYLGLQHSAHDVITDREHTIKVESGTLLETLTGTLNGNINSSHHQSADAVGEGLRINARSGDGVVEGLEWENPTGKPFLLLVQWHPERMVDKETSPFSNNIRTRFLQEAENYTR